MQTGTPVAPLDRRGGFPRWIRTAAGLREEDVTVVDLAAGRPLPPHGRFAGTSSPARRR